MSTKRVSEMTDDEIREMAGAQPLAQRDEPAAAERSRLWMAIRHSIPLDKPWRGEVLDLLWPVFAEPPTASL